MNPYSKCEVILIELDRKYELIRNLNIFPRPHKNTEKHPKCIKDKIYQLEIMHLLMGVIQ